MKSAALIAMLILTGCATTALPPTAVLPVAVPPPPPPVIARPALPIAEITAASAPDAVMRAYVASVAVLQGYARQLEKLLDGYRGTVELGERPAIALRAKGSDAGQRRQQVQLLTRRHP